MFPWECPVLGEGRKDPFVNVSAVEWFRFSQGKGWTMMSTASQRDSRYLGRGRDGWLRICWPGLPGKDWAATSSSSWPPPGVVWVLLLTHTEMCLQRVLFHINKPGSMPGGLLRAT